VEKSSIPPNQPLSPAASLDTALTPNLEIEKRRLLALQELITRRIEIINCSTLPISPVVPQPHLAVAESSWVGLRDVMLPGGAEIPQKGCYRVRKSYVRVHRTRARRGLQDTDWLGMEGSLLVWRGGSMNRFCGWVLFPFSFKSFLSHFILHAINRVTLSLFSPHDLYPLFFISSLQ